MYILLSLLISPQLIVTLPKTFSSTDCRALDKQALCRKTNTPCSDQNTRRKTDILSSKRKAVIGEAVVFQHRAFCVQNISLLLYVVSVLVSYGGCCLFSVLWKPGQWTVCIQLILIMEGASCQNKTVVHSYVCDMFTLLWTQIQCFLWRSAISESRFGGMCGIVALCPGSGWCWCPKERVKLHNTSVVCDVLHAEHVKITMLINNDGTSWTKMITELWPWNHTHRLLPGSLNPKHIVLNLCLNSNWNRGFTSEKHAWF